MVTYVGNGPTHLSGRAPRTLRACAWALVLALAVTLLAAFVVGRPARADVTAADWEPGNIISDGLFYDGNALDANGVQAVLDQRGAGCTSGDCLKTHREYAAPRAADAYCGAFGGGDLTAAQIIWQVGLACGISQKSLLVILQKESSLVTANAPSTLAYRAAMGMGCPDTAACDSQYYWLTNQVYGAARQLKKYLKYSIYRVGLNYIQYNPNTDCGGSQVYIENNATAALYNYTPYQPNTAALLNFAGTGDACSAYGNRNFFRLYNQWFGSSRFVVLGAMSDAWWAQGGPSGYIGDPIAFELCNIPASTGTAGCVQAFQAGVTAWSPRTGAFLVKGNINGAWQADRGPEGFLGWPVANETCGLVGDGCVQKFERGYIAWSPTTGAHEVKGAMAQAWWADGGPNGYLGYPKWDEGWTRGLTGVTQGFQHGSTAWSLATGAHLVKGSIEQSWWAGGGPNGYLGWPRWDEGCNAAGCTQGFQRGTVAWAPSVGAHRVLGAMEQTWWQHGGPFGVLGWPRWDEGVASNGSGVTQGFQNGSTAWSPATGAYPVPGPIDTVWWQHGGNRGAYGYPVRDEANRSQRFQGGTISY